MKRVYGSTFVVALVFAAIAAASSSDPKQMVLRLQEMPTGFSPASGSYYPITKAAAENGQPIAKLREWGYQTGYEADFKINSGSLTDVFTGPIDITTSATVYRTTGGAKASLASSAAACRKAPVSELSVGAKIGDEAHLCTLTKSSEGITGRAYIVIWRHGRYKGAVLLVATTSGASPTTAVSLARTQDARMG